MKKKSIGVLGAIAVILAGLGYSNAADIVTILDRILNRPSLGPYEVQRVVDGDTVYISLQGKPTSIRLLGYDTPEPVVIYARCKKEVALGKAATKRLKKLILSKEALVHLTSRKGRQGRVLGHLTINGTNIAEIAHREGWGKKWDGKRGTKPKWCA